MISQYTLLKENRDFSVIWVTSFFTLLFERAFIFIIPIFIFDITNLKQLVGLGSLFEILTILLFGIIAGYIIDSFNSKKVLLITNFILMILSIIGFVIFLYYESFLLFIIMIIFIVGLSRTNNLARTSILFNLFDGENLKLANAMFSLIFSLTMILGPVISAIIYNSLGIKGIFVLGFLVSLFSMCTFIGLNTENTLKKPIPFFQGILETFSLIHHNKQLKGIIIYQILLMGSSAVIASLLYVFIKDIFHQDTNFYTILVLFQGGGQLFASLFFVNIVKKVSTNILVFIFTIGIAFLEGFYVLFPNYYLILIFSFFVGVFIQIIFILSNTCFLQSCSSNDVGRLNGLKNTITSTTSILFLSFFSFLSAYLSIITVLLMSSIIMAGSAFVALKHMKE